MNWDQAATLVEQQRALIDELIRSEISSVHHLDARVRAVQSLLALFAHSKDVSSASDDDDDRTSMSSSTTDMESVDGDRESLDDLFNRVVGMPDDPPIHEPNHRIPPFWDSFHLVLEDEYRRRMNIDLDENRQRTELYAHSLRLVVSASFFEHRYLQLLDSVHYLRTSIEGAHAHFMREVHQAARLSLSQRRHSTQKRPHVNRLL